jgi:hypothetical protein
MQPQCPICHGQFFPWDIHQLRIENDAPGSTSAVPRVGTQLQRLLDAIADIADGHATVEEMQRVIGLCDAYHTSQRDSNPVRDRANCVPKPTDSI